jgi:hypothetical protein
MPPSIHKILIYGSLIIKNALVPIGQLSEEAQEASNTTIDSENIILENHHVFIQIQIFLISY